MIKFEVVKDEFRQHKNAEIMIPKRSTKYSAGYDICIPCDVTLKVGETLKVHTDLKCNMDKDLVMLILPRSSVGIKKGINLMNTCGVIDSDYYGNDSNDGNIILPLIKTFGEEVTLKAGEKVAQAIFVRYATSNDIVDTERKGGVGSTGEAYGC